jgi:hypothetical protein
VDVPSGTGFFLDFCRKFTLPNELCAPFIPRLEVLATKSRPLHAMPAKSRPLHAMPAKSRPLHAMPTKSRPLHAMLEAQCNYHHSHLCPGPQHAQIGNRANAEFESRAQTSF